ncbi:MAG: MFS transporter [Kiritimatiellaeota bacterium]|nr:MFS transporter [Kiritimatiellota bacterium]
MPTPAPATETRPAYVRFSLYYALLFMVNGIVYPYLPVILDGIGFSKTEIGSVLGLAPLVGVAAPPVWGGLADLLRRRRLVLTTAIGLGGCLFLALPFSPALSITAGLVVLYYVCREAVIPLSDGITFAHLGRRREVYGRVRAFGSLGFVASAALMAAVGAGRPGTMHLLFGAYAVFCIGHAAASAFLPDVPAPERTAGGHEFSWTLFCRPAVLGFVFAAFMARATMMGYYSFFSLFLREQLGFSGVGYLWALGPIAEIPVIFFSGWMIRRIGLRGLLALGLGAVTLRLAVYASHPTLVAVVAIQALHCLTFGAVHVASVTFVDRVFPPHLKATGQSVFAAVAVGMASLAGSSLAGWLVQRWSYSIMYGVLSVLALIGMIVAWISVRGIDGTPGESTLP